MYTKFGKYCKAYRVKHDLRMKDLVPTRVSSLSAFENGKSSNIDFLKYYAKLSIEKGEEKEFLTGLSEVLNHVECN